MRPKHKVDHSTPSSTDVKNEWNYTYTPLHGVYRGHYLLYFFFRILRYRSNRYVPYLQPTDGFMS
jgi:hypothetical protein